MGIQTAILQKTVNDTQLNNLGAESTPLVVNNLVRTLQAAQLNLLHAKVA